jgi:twitching motility two-component system response regulator PilG
LLKGKVVILRDPQSPYDKLPKIPTFDACPIFVSEPAISKPTQEAASKNTISNITLTGLPNGNGATKTYKVVCIDDSPAILREINRFLENYALEVHLISDSGKALREIIRLTPDIILLDLGKYIKCKLRSRSQLC